jgi:two-component sensor histidine kinase
MNLQLRKVDDVGAQRALQECRTRVESIALIHEQLYQSKDYARVPFSDYCIKLAHNIFHTLGTAPERVLLELEMDEVALPVDQAIPLGLVLNELITNALKHAFPGDARGRVRIQLSSDHDLVRLVVEDDGIGHDRSVSRPAALGMQLVHTLVRQLDGTLETAVAHGTRLTISFPAGGTL